MENFIIGKGIVNQEQRSFQDLDLLTFRMERGITLVEASAGTGKTYTIQYMVLDLLLQGVSLPKILVVTFTEAATKELKDRLQSFLYHVDEAVSDLDQADRVLGAILQRAIDQDGVELVHRRLQEALLQIDEAAIFTIHAFCQRALQENVFASNAEYQTDLIKDIRGAIRPFVFDFIREVNLSLTIPLPSCYQVSSLEARANRLSSFQGVAHPSNLSLLDLSGDLVRNVERLTGFAESKSDILKEFLSWDGKLNRTTYGDKFFEKLPHGLGELLADPMSVDHKFLGQISADQLLSKTTKKFVGQVQPSEFFTTCQQFLEAREAFYQSAIAYFDQWFIEKFSNWKKEAGLLSFDDMIKDLRRALRTSPYLIEQLQQKYEAAIVDEFQDTDAEQYEIFSCLFGQPNAGHFFAMIGDPKQAIYRFRGADLPTYLAARKKADRQYTLGVNYRSEPLMIQGVNQFFAEENFSHFSDEGNAIDFHPVEAPQAPRERTLIISGELEKSRLWEKEVSAEGAVAHKSLASLSLRQTVKDVVELLSLSAAGKAVFVTDPDDLSTARSVQLSDIAVLINKHEEAEFLSGEFAKEGILSVRKNDSSVFKTAEANHLFLFLSNCLRAKESLVHAFLATPLGYGNLAAVATINDFERQRMFARFLEYGRQWQEGKGVSTIFFHLLEEEGVRERLLAQTSGERSLTNYMQLVEILDEMERTKSLSREQIILYLKTAILSSDPVESKEQEMRLESDRDAVSIMTLHSSKGLEFPIVFLPTLWSRSPKSSRETVFAGSEDNPDLFDQEVLNESSFEELIAEDKRLGYVAMTRAVNLCVYYNLTDYKMPNQKQSYKNGWFGSMYPKNKDAANIVSSGIFQDISRREAITPVAVPEEDQVFARSFPRDVHDRYRITSFTSLHRFQQEDSSHLEEPFTRARDEEAMDAVLLPETDELLGTENRDELLLNSFLAGSRTGTCIHEILDQCDFTDQKSWVGKIETQLLKHFPNDNQERREAKLAEAIALLEQLTAGSFRDEYRDCALDLSKVSPNDCFYELDFFFPIDQLNLYDLGKVLESALRRMEIDTTLQFLDIDSLEGFLTGSIDLFFKQEDCLYILDWKTNRLPENAQTYSIKVMQELMVEGGYYLQALLYTCAAYLFLKKRLGNQFSYDQHIGGFIYCFVRGLRGDNGWLHQRFTEEEIVKALQTLGH